MKSLYLRQTALDEYFLANVAQRVGDRPSRNLAPDDDHHDDDSHDDDSHDDESHDDHIGVFDTLSDSIQCLNFAKK